MRRYDDLVEVRLAPEQPGPATTDEERAPRQFVWRGRLYVVGTVLAHWVEVGAWWRVRDAEGLPVAAQATGRQVWRVEARAGRSSTSGIYDLTRDAGTPSRSSWRLARALD